MYTSNGNDIVKEIDDLPQSSIGAPCPLVIASEHQVAICYYLENKPENWDGSYVKIADQTTSSEPLAIVEFESCYAHYFGPPNDEAFKGHPLSAKGVSPYQNYEILESSWISYLEEMNAVHPYHKKESFLSDKKHFILAFHDSVFECIAKEYKVHLGNGSITDMIPVMQKIITH